MRTLSSRSTFYTKFVLPGIFLAALPVWIVLARDPHFGPSAAVFWFLGCAICGWWAVPIKKVSLVDDRFVVSNFRREITVPTAHLSRISEEWWNRTPNVVLYFDPPTEFGRKVRVIVGSKKKLSQLATELRALAKKTPNQALQPTAPSGRG